MDFLSSNNNSASNTTNMNATSFNSLFTQQFLDSQSAGNFPLMNNHVPSVKMSTTPNHIGGGEPHLNAQFSSHVNTNFPIIEMSQSMNQSMSQSMNQFQTGHHLDFQQILSQYLSYQASNNSTTTTTPLKRNIDSEEMLHYPFQLAMMNQVIEEQQHTPISSASQNISPTTNTMNTRSSHHLTNNQSQQSAIIYHSVEDCIIDENNLYGNINILNADETKQTKILVMPTAVYGKHLQPVLDKIKEGSFQISSIGIPSHESRHQLIEKQQWNLSTTAGYHQHPHEEESSESGEEEEEDMITQDKSSSTIDSSIFKNSNNYYRKTSNKKGIKKKRKYIRSGLFRKDKNGHFLFSSADRSRLATLIETTTTAGSTNDEMGSEVLLDVNTQAMLLPPPPPSSSNHDDFTDEEDRLGFELYCRETIPLHRDAASNTILLKEQWKVLPQEERDRYKRSVAMGINQQQQTTQQDVAFTQFDDEFLEMMKDNNNNSSGRYSRVKRPLNAYNIFCKIHFPGFQQQYPDLTINQISKLIGEKWKSLSSNEKEPYIEKSKSSQPVVKKPLNSYNLYCKQNFEIFKKRYPDLSIHLLSRKVADSWKNLSEEEKRLYYEDALKQRQENLLHVQQSIQH